MIENDVLRIIKQRRSTRSFAGGEVSDEELQAVLEAGQYAPNAGDQAWHFTAVQNRELLNRLNLAAKEAARQHAIEFLRELGNNAHFNCLYDAPALVLVSGDGNAHMPLDADCATATQNMLLAAESLGLASCWIYFVLMAFDSPQGGELRKELKIPEGYRPYDVAVFGRRNGAAAASPERKPGLITIIK